MEAKKDNDENSALLEKLAGNDYDAFLALSMLSNHKNGTKYLGVIAMAEYIKNPVSETQAVTDVIDKIERDHFCPKADPTNIYINIYI